MGNRAEKSKKEGKGKEIKKGKKSESGQKQGHELPADQMASLQQQVGNQAVQAMVAQQEGNDADKGKQAKNKTGMPDNLKTGIENLSGLSLDGVKVHYNSSKPAALQAHAYAQGTDIHLGSGQEKHLPHEAWHVVQQMQGRVKPTRQVNGMPVNDDASLESEADQMGAKAAEFNVQRVEEEEAQMQAAEEEVQMVEEEPIQTEEEEELMQGAGMEEEEAMQGAGMEEEEAMQGAGMEEEEAMQGKRK